MVSKILKDVGFYFVMKDFQRTMLILQTTIDVALGRSEGAKGGANVMYLVYSPMYFVID